MKNYIEEASENVRIEEGSRIIEQLLLECYFGFGVSTKELARKTLLPIPVAAAIKKELIKSGALAQDRGVYCTAQGKAWIEQEWGYRGLNNKLHRELMADDAAWGSELADLLSRLEELFRLRPQVNVQIDQSKCTPETSLRRAILCLRQHSLIGKRILCVGDDDLVSISIGLLLQRLFPGGEHSKTTIEVVDIDERFLTFIRDIAGPEKLPVKCRQVDLRQPLPEDLHDQFDCFFTDPPYTLQGMTLFVSRGISALKNRKGLPIFLSFAHKSPEFMLAMQRELVRMGLTVNATLPRFNAYEGAEMIANRSQMIILKTTEQTTQEYTGFFADALYTGEVKRTMRSYRCIKCGESVEVGFQGHISTIEELKNLGCRSCGNDTFHLVDKKIIQIPGETNKSND
ncbi:bis-aminopropyl spermidine synthase family protein [Paenibacillus sp. sptzw28]|uniref:bis-aminopropyl spermidine synthase family protein n=1 Tax=Paenibacillus sp. sptzw28 TaxID=715179 RepID=UPI001C6EAC93|nr:bis-aminopropyl spermidine synthase family protein [Paenibacillus sp. sptzw28]QYR21300.1 bis-aminopropyl spermidine synthase family protein [Paenibacillus sp. sptzw28]